MNDLELRLNEIKFSNSIKRFLREYPVTELKKQLNAICTLINHSNVIDIGNAWMFAMAGELDYDFDEIVILLYNNGMSKNAIRTTLKCSPNKVYEVLDEEQEIVIKPKLEPRISEAVAEFITKLEDFMDIWLINLEGG